MTKADRRRLNPGDRICGECGEGNPGTRKFCRRCGTSLSAAEVVKEKWWRRFLPKPKTLKAGGRPGQPGVRTRRGLPEFSGVMKRIRWTVSICGLLAGLAYSFYSPFHNWVNHEVTTVQQRISTALHPQYAPIHPSAITATASEPNHGPDQAVDSFKNTDWEVPASTQDPTIRLTFPTQENLDRILVTNGSSDNYTGTNRPHQLHLVYSDGQSDDLSLTDESSPQQFTLHHGRAVQWVEVHVASQYQAINGKDMALNEVEFYTRSS